MRLVLLAAAAALLALPAAAPTAVACHPALGVPVDVPGVARVRVDYDHGCGHHLVPVLCLTVEWRAIPAPPTQACAPQP